ncbi:MAG: response regulator [Deltaproteobacteria bacterium]|nr:response regulator [Deltaproteobacteria bacterium]
MEGLQVVDRDFRYLYVNPVAAEHGQTTPSALIGRTMSDAYPGIETTEMYERLRRVLEDGTPDQMENEFRFPDGSKGWFELRMAPVPEGAVIISFDITQSKTLAAQMVRAQRMEALGQLAGGFAHDFNNLLTVVRANASFVKDGLIAGVPVGDDVDQIISAAGRGAELVKQMLTFARRAPVEAQVVEVARALQEVDAMLQRTLGADIELTTRVAPGVGAVLIDRSALEQVLMNLALNARDAMPDGGAITIEADRTELQEHLTARQGIALEPGSYVRISVSDTGAGMDASTLDHIFEPFFTTKDETHGTGLGLSTSWGLIRQAGGVLTAYSELGMGSTFRIYLQRTAAETASPSVAPSEDEPSIELAGRVVLVVEDREPIRLLLTRMLERVECEVHAAKDAAEALIIVQDRGAQLDLMISDVVMPKMSGFELADRVAEQFPLLPIIMISGYAEAALSRRTGARPNHLLLSKPFTPNQLIEVMRRALGSATEPG